jgi:hypothetical protein
MNIVFLLTQYAIVRLLLILRAILVLAKVDGFISPARTGRHDFNL